MRKFLTYFVPFSIAAVFILLIFLAIKPAEISRESSIKASAEVGHITKGGLNDIMITMRGLKGRFYIPAAASSQFNIDTLQKKLGNKTVQICYAKPGVFSGLSPIADNLHITELKLGTEIIYSELDK